METLFKKKIENLHSNLMECYRDSSNYSPTITGFEREIFQSALLSKILPNNYRFGCGTITDHRGKETGQVDCVIELPFSISFPISSGHTRLYLADTVGAAFEVKSNLSTQWDSAVAKIKEIKSLNRYKLKEADLTLLNDLKIPTFIIAYKGFSNIETIYNRLGNMQPIDWPNGIFIIESGIFVSPNGIKGQYECTGNGTSTLGFISCLYETLQQYAKLNVNLNGYSDLLI